MIRDAFMKPEAIAALEETWALRKDAVRLLGLVVAEWKSDPESVKCFDLRTVEEAKRVIGRLEELRGADE